ncbi:MAG: hypothetical protein KC621_32135 [Myxococcales bacterium]|nr:hypothetical protein [Myxococcales bacterium]
MNRHLVVATALLGWGGVASASELDDDTTLGLYEREAPDPGAREVRHRSGRKSGSNQTTHTQTSTRGGTTRSTTATPVRHETQQVTVESPRGTLTGTRWVGQRDASTSWHQQDGDWGHANTTRTATRSTWEWDGRYQDRSGTRTNSWTTGTVQGQRDGRTFDGQGHVLSRGVVDQQNDSVTWNTHTGYHGTVDGRPVNTTRTRTDTVNNVSTHPIRPNQADMRPVRCGPTNQTTNCEGGTRPGGGSTRPGGGGSTGGDTTGGSTRPGGGSTRPGGSTGGTVVTTSNGRPNTGPTVVHTTGGRPNTGPAVVHTTGGRPPTTVVHGGRPPATVVHAAPATHVVVHQPPRVRTVSYTHVYPYHGVFVYGPRPSTHVTYVEQASGPVQVPQRDLPKRDIDRANSLAVGVMGGALMSATPGGSFYGDPGLGLVGRYRPAEPVALELGVAHHAMSLDAGSRSQTMVNGDVKLFAFPWTRVSPYALAGATYNAANIQEQVLTGDTIGMMETVDGQWGLDAGLGLELAMGNNFALDLQGKYIGWMDERYEGEAPGAFQFGGGLAFHFR